MAKKFSAADLAAAIEKCRKQGFPPMVVDFVDGSKLVEKARLMTREEVRRGQRYLDREPQRNAFHQAELKRSQREFEKAEREARAEADAKRLAAGSAAISTMHKAVAK